MSQFLQDKYNRFALLILIAGAYLIFYNLENATVWHDEAVMAVIADKVAATGEFTGWDGRNLYVGDNGTSIDSQFRPVSYPPWPIMVSALGIAIFDKGELGVRFFHSLLGFFSIILLWLILKRDFPNNPRLHVLGLAFFTFSAQTILYMRMGRYAADAIFFSLLSYYFYRQYISNTGKMWHLAIVTLATILGFLNHYGITVAFALALATWHLIYFRRQTTSKQWLEVTIAGILTGGACLGYLLLAGIIGSDEKLEFIGTQHPWPWHKRHAYLVYFNFRDYIGYAWLPFWGAVWMIYLVKITYLPNLSNLFGSKKKTKKRKKKKITLLKDENKMIIAWAVLISLFLLYSGLTAQRSAAVHLFADSRYLVAALPFTALLLAACVNWLWKLRGAYFAIPLMVILLNTKALAYPWVQKNFFGRPSFFTLPAVVQEIHQPYVNATRGMIDYLQQHSQQDETIHVLPWQDYAVTYFYFSDRLIFCCGLNSKDTLPEDKVRELGVPLYSGEIEPDWIITHGMNPFNTPRYQQVYQSEYYYYPTQRPELEFRTFAPVPLPGSMRIYRKKQ